MNYEKEKKRFERAELFYETGGAKWFLLLIILCGLIVIINLNNVSAWSDDGSTVQNVTGCNTLNTTNAVYNMNISVNSTGTCFNILANNITLNCAGNIINYSYSTSTAGYGVNSSYNSTTIKNCVIKEGSATTGSKYAIYFKGAKNGTINNNTITTFGGSGYGIYLYTSSNSNILSNNTITTSGSSGHGIYLVLSSNFNTLSNNTITANGVDIKGIYLSNSLGDILLGNRVNTSAGNGYVILGFVSSEFNHTLGPDNYAEGLPVNYTYNADNLVFNGVDFTQYGQVIFAYSRNITIINSNFSSDSLNFYYTNNSNILNNFINTTKGYGIYFRENSNFNNISNNIIISSGKDNSGVYLYSSVSSNNILNNTITTSGERNFGVYLYSSVSSNNILNNTITTSGDYSYGIRIITSSTNTFLNNTITTSGSSGYGIYLSLSSTNNSFSGMNIKTNGTTAYSIYISDANHNFTIRDSILNSSKVGVTELYVASAVKGGTWNFTNVTRSNGNPITINWIAGGNGTLNMIWYLDVNIISGGSALSDANVTSWNVNNVSQFSVNTAATGFIPRQTLLEYTNVNNTLITYYSNYTVNTTKTGYTNDTQSVNMSTNRQLNVALTDNVPPLLTILSPLNQTYTTSQINFNITSNENLSSCVVSLNNFVTNNTMTLNSSLTGANYTNSSIADGSYTAKFSCNDTSGNWNSTGQVSFTIDTTSPQVTINSPTSTTYTTSSVLFNVTLNENGTCLFSLDLGATNYTFGTINNQNFNYTLFLSDGSYTANFYCNDTAGNRNNTINVSFSIDTSTPASTDENSGSGGLPTLSTTNSQLNQGVVKILSEGWTIQFKIGNLIHKLKVNKITNNSVSITLSSTSQTAILYTGNEKKFDVNDDNYYDVYVKLNSISNNKANLTIKSIYEKIIIPAEQKKAEENQKQTNNQTKEPENGSFLFENKIYLLIALIIIVIIILALSLGLKRHKKKRYYQKRIKCFY